MFSLKKHVLSGDRNKSFNCRRCLSSPTNENTLLKHKQRCNQPEKTSTSTSIQSHLY